MVRKKMIFSIIMLLLLVVATVGVSFAAFTFTREGAVENTLETSTIMLTYTEGKTGITLNEAYPMSDEKGKVLVGENNVFDFTVQATLGTSTVISYEVSAVKIPITDTTPLEDDEVKLYLEKAVDPDTTYQQVLSPSNFLPIENQTEIGSPKGSMILDSGAFYTQGTTIHNYRLRMWIDEGAIIPSGESRKYGVKINVYSKQLLSNSFTDESCFTFDASTGTITDYDDNCPKDVVIPYTIGGVEVTTIGKGVRGAFGFCNKQLTSVIIPNSVTSIGSTAFQDNQLTSIVIPNSVTIIGEVAFLNNQLTSLPIFVNKVIIKGGAFNNNQLPDNQAFIYERNADGSIDYTTLVSYGGIRRDNIIVPENVTTIGKSAFFNNQLTSVTFSNNVTNIGDYAFSNNLLTGVEILNSVTTIGSNAFSNNQLTSVEIPNSVTTIGRNAFSNNQLASVIIPDSVITIGAYAFYKNQLTSITIPSSVTTIGNSVFSNNQLTSVEIPNSVTTIENSAFSNNQLITVTIGKGVTNIENFVFNNNPSLTKIINLTGRGFQWNGITQGSASGQEVPFVTGTTSTGIVISAS